jgi:hypothetical protein
LRIIRATPKPAMKATRKITTKMKNSPRVRRVEKTLRSRVIGELFLNAPASEATVNKLRLRTLASEAWMP